MTENVFVAVPKTASSSMMSLFRDNVTRIGHNLRDVNYISLEDYLQNKVDTFSFGFVRNPFDKVVSSFFYLNQSRGNELDYLDYKKYIQKYDSNFNLFVKEGFKNKNILNQIHFRPQYKWVCDKNNNLLLDFVGKYENLYEDLDFVCKKLCIKSEELRKINVSEHSHFLDYYDDESKKIVFNVYKKDFELFGYIPL